MLENQQQNFTIQLAAWSDLDILAMVEELLARLNQREQDILAKRFGLRQQTAETLESIGQAHGLTRERIRQVENSGINKIKRLPENLEKLARLKELASTLLTEHGGLLSRQHLYQLLRQLPSAANLAEGDYYNHLDFVLGRILDTDFILARQSPVFEKYFTQPKQKLQHLEDLAIELVAIIKNLKKLLTTEEIFDLIKTADAYRHAQAEYQDADQDKALQALLQAITSIKQNKFGQWGLQEWREVRPRTINDKIYLVLKNHGQPLYYGDIAKKISELGFDAKAVNPATTHNELILDDKYILVGRGLYGLKEWGLRSGTVAEVIAAILQEAGRPLTKQEIMAEVLKQRQVKITTINLALMNKDKFTKVEENKYTIKSS